MSIAAALLPEDKNIGLRGELQRLLVNVLPTGARIVGIDRAPAGSATSHECNRLTIRVCSGTEVILFLKEFRSAALAADRTPALGGVHRRAARELSVYRDLLADAGLGTASYYGAFEDTEDGRLVIALEFVDGARLRSCTLDAWIAAARWLGHLQAYFARHPERRPASHVLLHHDFFGARAEGAAQAVAQAAPHLAGRLAGVTKNYHRLVDVMTGQPRTLVHGSYRSQNILVVSATGRVCPVDWEFAAIGSPLYDLAFVSDGFRPPDRDRLWDAYLKAAGDAYAPPRDREKMRHVVDCFRLHKVLKSLSEACDKNFPEPTVAKLIRQAEELHDCLAHGM
jgi:Phosphotransferase enzyme family